MDVAERRRRSGARREQDGDPKLDVDKARQGDDDRENFRVLDASLLLTIIAFIILGVYFAMAAVR